MYPESLLKNNHNSEVTCNTILPTVDFILIAKTLA